MLFSNTEQLKKHFRCKHQIESFLATLVVTTPNLYTYREIGHTEARHIF